MEGKKKISKTSMENETLEDVEPVKQMASKDDIKTKMVKRSENLDSQIEKLQSQLELLQTAFYGVEENRTKMEILYHTEKKAFEEEKVLLTRKVEELDKILQSEVKEMKSHNIELEKRLDIENLQRKKVENDCVAMVTELNKLATDEKEVLQQLNNKLGAEVYSVKEQVSQLSEQLEKFGRQVCDLQKHFDSLSAEPKAVERGVSECDNQEKEEQKSRTTKQHDSDGQECVYDLTGEQKYSPVKKTELSTDDTISEESLDELGDILDHFVTTTSMHGIGQIIGSKWIVLRILWIILTLGAMGGLIYHLYSICVSFYKWPKQTQVSVGLNNSVYPAVTICNENIIRQDALEKMQEFSTLKKFVKYINQQLHTENETLGSVSGTGFSSYSNKTMVWLEAFGTLFDSLQLTDEEKNLIESALNRSSHNSYSSDKDIDYLFEEIFQTIYMGIGRESRSKASHNITEMLISCTFDGYTCYPENFTLYQTSSTGNCWTLSSSSMTAKTTGPRAGLSLVLFLQNHQFLEGLSHGYGARLAVHAQGTKPVPTEDGIFISSASETSIGLAKGTITRVGPPHGRCNDGVYFSERYGFVYSRQACQIMCLMEEIISTCGCYGNFHEEFALLVSESAYICNSTQERSCLNDILWEIDKKTKHCECENPCSETYFYTSISTRQWPTDAYATLMVEKVCHKDDEACLVLRQLIGSRHLLNNFVKINIFFETLNYEEIEEKPLMDSFQFLASIGGALGLWVGLSVLSFCEIVQLVVKILDFMFCPQKCIRVPVPKSS